MPEIIAGVALLALALTIASHLCAHVFLSRRPASDGPRPPVSLLKPLKGADDDLYANLATFTRQRYPRYQIVFGAEDPDDPALAVARRIRDENPHLDITVVAGADPLGRNPKVTNLASLSRFARHDFWLISDSNVRVRPDYLRDTMACFADRDVGMVTNPFAGVGERTPGAAMENLHLNSLVAGCMSGAELLTDMACVVGKSMVFRRAGFEALGGWAAVKDILAEDYVLATRFHEAGHRVVTAPHRIETVNVSWSARRFLNRHLRWGQIRRWNSTRAFAGEPLMNPIPFALAAALAGLPWVAGAVVALKIMSDSILAKRLRGRAYRLRDLVLIPVKDLVIAGVWIVAIFRRRVWWRGNALRIGPGSALVAERFEPALAGRGA
jgi:ceramide glucosyltransferase